MLAPVVLLRHMHLPLLLYRFLYSQVTVLTVLLVWLSPRGKPMLLVGATHQVVLVQLEVVVMLAGMSLI